jgi:hypothetical protein
VAQFVIDDFNVDSTSTVSDLVVGGPITGPSTIDGANIVMNGLGWTRTLTADLTAGDDMDTVVCSGCQAGHVTMGGGNSNGIGTYTYTGSATDLSSYTLLGFDWGADQGPGASVDIIVGDGTNTSTAASWSGLANTGGSAPGDLVAQALMGINWGAVNSSAVTEIQFEVTGVQNMDSIIDNIHAVPVPAAVWLFGSGLLGLVGIARRKKA